MLSCTNKDADHYDLMMIGHIDTVFPRGMLEKNPYRVDGDKIYGLGTADMKQGALMMYYLMKDMDKSVLDKLSIAVVFNPDEEIGSMYSMPAYKDIAQKSKYCYIYEPTSINGLKVIERKGCLGLIAEFFGVEGHAGYMFTNGSRSAIHEMAYWIVEFNKLQDKENDTTVNAGVVNGGKAINIVAEYAKLDLGIRFFKPEIKAKVQETLARLEEHAKENGIKVTYQKNRFISPLAPTEEALEYANHAMEVAKAVDENYHYTPAGGLSDANQIADFGPIIIDGFGPAGAKIHTEYEHLYVDEVEKAFKVSEILITDLANSK
jgi:glutamate carboxypeptidase